MVWILKGTARKAQLIYERQQPRAAMQRQEQQEESRIPKLRLIESVSMKWARRQRSPRWRGRGRQL